MNDLLEHSELLAGDVRFLRDFFLPAHGRDRDALYRAELEKARGPALKGRLLRLLGDREGALAALKKAPRSAESLAYEGEARLVAEPRAALALLEEALRREARPEFIAWKAYALFLLQDSTGALEALAPLDRADAGLVAWRVLRAIIRERAGDLAGAEADLDAAVKASAGSPGLYALRATVRFKKGDKAGSIEDAHEALLRHPENMDGFVRMLYLSLGVKNPVDQRSEHELLLHAVDRFLEQDPDCGWAHAVRAGVLGSSALQLAPLRKAVSLDPNRAWIRAFLGRSLCAGGPDGKVPPREAKEGLEQLDAAVRLSPGIGWLYAWRAEARKRLGRLEEALSDLDRALELQPHYSLARAWRATLREDVRDLEGAVADWTVCLTVLPRPTFHHRRANLNWQLGRVPEALADLSHCALRSPKDALAYGGLGWLVLKPVPKVPNAVTPLSTRHLFDRSLEGPSQEARWAVVRTHPACNLRSPSELIALASGPIRAANPRSPWLGRLALDEGRVKQGLALLPGKDALSLCWRAEALARLGRPGESLKAARAALARVETYFPARLWEIAALARLGRRREALESLLVACRADPAQAESARWWAHWTLPRLAVAQPQDGPAARLLLAEYALRGKNRRRGRLLLEPLPPRALGPRGLVLRGLCRADTGEPAAADRDLAAAVAGDAEASVTALEAWIKDLPSLRPEALVCAYAALGWGQRLLGRREAARRADAVARELLSGVEPAWPSALALRDETAERSLALSDNPRARAARGASLLRRGDAQAALPDLEAALKAAPRDAEFTALAGDACLRLGRDASALKLLDRAVKLDPRGGLALMLRGEARRAKGEPARCWEDVRRAVESDPEGAAIGDSDAPWARAWRGGLARRAGQMDEAERRLDAALAADASCFWALAWRGELRLAQERLEDAVKDLDAALSLFPQFVDALTWRGRALCALGRCEAARRDFKAALKADPMQVWALVGLGVCLEKGGRADQASLYLERARRAAPGLFAVAGR